MTNRKQRRADSAQTPAIPPAAQRAFADAIRHHQSGRFAEAVSAYRRATALHPSYAEAWQNLGSALSDLGRPAEAIPCLQKALGLRPQYPVAQVNLGNAFWATGRAEEAIRAYHGAIALKPDFAEAHTFLAIVLGEQGALDAAFAACRRALALQPGYAEAHNTLGNLLRTAGRTAEAVPCYRRAVALAPGYPDGHFNLGMALLALGEMGAGWPEYEWRWQTPQMIAAVRRLPRPQWQGEAADGRTLLIHAEQGSGDALQFCRYAALAAARGFRVILEAPKPLVRLFRSLRGVAAVVVQGEPLPDFDVHVPMMSLPLLLGTRLDTIPREVLYLFADAGRVEAWTARLPPRVGDELRVGLAWAGNPSLASPGRAAMDRRRSLAPERLAPLFDVPGLRFDSLQKDGPRLPGHLPVLDVMGGVEDFADTAALLATLDLVISVDTSVVHLAGALGQPVWLLDRFDPDWRWLTDRRDSPWYPTLRLYRQPRAGDWESVLAEVARDLAGLASGRPRG
jgi:tetratricopeptide (TPR) repeat protein